MGEPKLRIERRADMNGRPCVAPFIDGWNVWDIPEQEWTHAVQKAVLHAYELGWRHCHVAHSDLHCVQFDLDARFKETTQ